MPMLLYQDGGCPLGRTGSAKAPRSGPGTTVVSPGLADRGASGPETDKGAQ